MALDQEVTFFRRVADPGLVDLIGKFKAKDMCSHYAFAFASSLTPGMGSQSDPILTPMLLAEIADGRPETLPALRQLWWEAWTCLPSP